MSITALNAFLSIINENIFAVRCIFLLTLPKTFPNPLNAFDIGATPTLAILLNDFNATEPIVLNTGAIFLAELHKPFITEIAPEHAVAIPFIAPLATIKPIFPLCDIYPVKLLNASFKASILEPVVSASCLNDEKLADNPLKNPPFPSVFN